MKIISWVMSGHEKVWNMVSTLKPNVTGKKKKAKHLKLLRKNKRLGIISFVEEFNT